MQAEDFESDEGLAEADGQTMDTKCEQNFPENYANTDITW